MSDDNYVARYRLRPMNVEAGQVLPSPGKDDMPNRLSIAALSGWMMAHGFTDFKVVRDHGALGLDLYASTGDSERVSPGDWVVRTPSGGWASCPKDGFAEIYEPAP